MKKKIFSIKEIGIRKRQEYYTISISKIGYIVLNKYLSALLRLSENKIVIWQDEDRPMDWYIEIDNSDIGIQARPKNDEATVIQSVYLYRQIVESLSLEFGLTYRFLVSKEPTNGSYAIITKSATASVRQRNKK